MNLVMTIDDLHALVAREFPQMQGQFEILELHSDGLSMRMKINDSHLRPGGTISGPSMFSLADCAYYLATLAMIGPKALTVTTSCAIDFMRKPAPGDLIGRARILKLGKLLSVGDVLVYSEGMEAPVARASLTYAIPPKG
jgi:uncharacterized protein (TIGR00369 family)